MTPKTKTILITHADKSVSVMQFVLTVRPDFEREGTKDEIDAEIARINFGDKPVTGWREIKKSELPKDRTFRDAWRDTGKVEPDMPTAREIHKVRLRGMRDPLFAKLDTEYMRADEVGDLDEKKRIAGLKQQLRDVTDDPKIENAKDAASLKKAIPSVLK